MGSPSRRGPLGRRFWRGAKKAHFFTTRCTTTDEVEAQAAVGLWGGGFGRGSKRLTSLLHCVLQLTKLKPKPQWASGTVVLAGFKKAHFFTTRCNTTDQFEAQAAAGSSDGGFGGVSKKAHFFIKLCTTTDQFEAQAAVGLSDCGFGRVQKRLTFLLHGVLQLANSEPKPPWASRAVVLDGVQK